MKIKKLYYLLIMLSIFTMNNCRNVNTDCKSTKISDEFMELTGSFKKIDDNSIRFSLLAKRLEIKDGEYLPNSENFRVTVYNSDNTPIFSSDYEQNYFQAIMDVEPKSVGDEKEFEYIWNIRDNFKKKVIAGKYTSKLMIPAVPDSYFIKINFEIE